MLLKAAESYHYISEQWRLSDFFHPRQKWTILSREVWASGRTNWFPAPKALFFPFTSQEQEIWGVKA